jgi:hypothetical protein
VRVRSSQVTAFNDLFETRVGIGRPSSSSVVVSICFHAFAATCLALLSPRTPPPTFEVRRGPIYYPTELHIGEKRYLVTRIPLLPEKMQAKSSARAKTPAPAKSAAPPAPRPAPVEIAAASAPPSPRKFVPPPEIKPDVVADQTLIQLDSPPDLRPQDTLLPPFRAWSAQVPKIARPFVSPGRPKPPVEQAPVLISPPALDLVHAEPSPVQNRPNLVLPALRATVDAPPQVHPDAPISLPPGDLVNIISANSNPPVAADKLVIPPGNIVAAEQAGGKGVTPHATGNGGSTDLRPAAGPATAAGQTDDKRRDAVASASNTGPAAAPAMPATAAGGGVTTTGSAAKKVIIVRPETGNFDAMVTQAASMDMFPESRGLLTGRPVYTVYLSVGTPKDWALYFCVPNERPPDSMPGATVIQLTSVTPVKAPYPTKIARPVLSLPSYYKYLLVHGFVSQQGKVQTMRIATSINAEVDALVLDALQDWEFRPATRDGAPILVEFLLVIPRTGL